MENMWNTNNIGVNKTNESIINLIEELEKTKVKKENYYNMLCALEKKHNDLKYILNDINILSEKYNKCSNKYDILVNKLDAIKSAINYIDCKINIDQ